MSAAHSVHWARQLWRIFDRGERQRLAVLAAMMLVGAGFEAVGVGAVVPFIAMLANRGIIASNPTLQWLYGELGFQSTQRFMLASGIVLLLVFLLKNLYLALLGYAQARFSFRNHAALASRLLEIYLHSPYTFHLQRNSAELLRNVTAEVNGVISGVLMPCLILVTEALVLAAIFALLALVQPYIALVTVVVLGGTVFAAQRLLKPLLARYGQQRAADSALMFRWVNQSVGGIKETKVLGRERFFMDAFRSGSAGYAQASCMLATLNTIPRLLVETLAACGVMLVVVLMLARGAQLADTLPVLALFAMAAIRIMPSMTKMFVATNSVRFYYPSVETVYCDLHAAAPAPVRREEAATPAAARSALHDRIEMQGVSYRYPGSEEWAIRDVSLAIRKNASVGLVGRSGSGKSTLIDVLLGLLDVERGTILIDGRDLREVLPAWQRTVGYVPQTVYLTDDTVRRNVALGRADPDIDDGQVWRSLHLARLDDFVRGLPKGLDTEVGERGVRFSGGERQRIGIARALYHDPEVLVFDEATSALDNRTEAEIVDTINAIMARKTVIVVAHRLTTVRQCDVLYFMSGGTVADSGAFQQLMTTSADFRAMAGEAASAPPATVEDPIAAGRA